MNSPAELQTEDLTLMRRIGARDGAALRTLYERHSGLVHGICLRILHDRGEAEQVLVDVFAEAWERCDRFDATRGSVSGYLAMLARSRAIDRARSRSSQARHAKALDAELRNVLDAATAAHDPIVADERKTAVRSALSTLGEGQRAAVELAFYEGLTHSEIAVKLDKPIGTVKTQIRQGLIRMRDALRRHWEGARAEP